MQALKGKSKSQLHLKRVYGCRTAVKGAGVASPGVAWEGAVRNGVVVGEDGKMTQGPSGNNLIGMLWREEKICQVVLTS